MSGEKTEKPTPKRRREARKKGQVPKTQELAAWTQVLVLTYLLEWVLATATDGLRGLSRQIGAAIADPDPAEALGILGDGMRLAATAVLPMALAMGVIGVAATGSQTGLALATKNLKPSFSRVNPFAGIKRMFKPAGLWQGGKSLLKILLLTFVAWQPVQQVAAELVANGQIDIWSSAGRSGEVVLEIARRVAYLGLVLAGFDYGIQRRQIGKATMMTKQEIKEEHRQSDGNPHVRSEMRHRMASMSRNRMIANVADATVVLVNPTHIAVALRYSQGMGAPVVVAKGKGHVAQRIREEAERNFVPVVRDVMLARTLERACAVDRPIPPDLYEVVARLLAFVIQVGKRASVLGGVLQNPGAAPVVDDLAAV